MKLTIGVLLIVFGIFVLVAKGITYTKSEKVLDIGPLEAKVEREKTVPIHPLVGGAALVAGVVLLSTGRKG
jgi:hypothetical protein